MHLVVPVTYARITLINVILEQTLEIIVNPINPDEVRRIHDFPGEITNGLILQNQAGFVRPHIIHQFGSGDVYLYYAWKQIKTKSFCAL